MRYYPQQNSYYRGQKAYYFGRVTEHFGTEKTCKQCASTEWR